jgi:hypothetical protein
MTPRPTNLDLWWLAAIVLADLWLLALVWRTLTETIG